MKIKKLILKGYVRLFLSHINKIEYTPENKVNLILGTNGGGKSSLMKELSPLPADLKREFEEDGYKYIEIEHYNTKYVLSSGFIGKNKHSFEVDGDELNPAGTKKVQLALVKEHFNITPDIHNVMLGLKGFTTMSVMERKNWLTNISIVDYTYSLSIFNKLKQRNRDIVGALKITQSELTKSDSSIISKEDKDKITEEISILKELINLLMQSKLSVNQITTDSEAYIKNIIDASYLLLNKMSLPEDIDKRHVDKKIVELNHNLSNNKDKKVKLEKTLKELMFIEDSKTSGTLDDADKKVTSIKKELSDLAESIYIDINIEDINRFKSMFDYVHNELLEVLQAIVSNTVDEYTLNDYKEDMSKVTKLNELINSRVTLANKLNNDKSAMEHKRDHNSVTCNVCSNTWSVGFSKKDYDYTIAKLEEANKVIEDSNKEIQEITDRAASFNSKLESVDTIRKMFKDDKLSVLQPMFRYINANSDIINEPNKALDILFTLSNDLNKWLKYNTLITDLDIALKDREIVAEKREIELKHFNANKEGIEEDLFKTIASINSDMGLVTKLNLYVESRNALSTNYDILVRWLKGKKTELNNNLIDERNKGINESITMLNVEVSRLEHRLSESIYNERLIDGNKEKIKTLKLQKEATDLLIKGMSPTNGLIGKSITNFLNVFTRDMNDIINSIWNYDMEILPCKITEDNDLDYKFEVKIDNRMPVKDVSETSSSQQEIIDLAFKIVSMKYLKMEESYLLLDEFGRTFDEAHSKNAYDIIDILSNSSFSNVFIISHFAATYSRFKNADISLLNGDNMILDKELEVNRVMKIS